MSPLYQKVGPYEIQRELGSGGMADVFVAADCRDGSIVALKIPRRDPEVRSAERVGALLQSRLAELDPRVARVYEIGEDDGVPYVAMEYVEGEDLSERIARGPLPPQDALRIAIELCDLLATAHAFDVAVDGCARHGIVHGDLKPRNVRLAHGGRVRVVDFGIAKALSETRKRTHNEFGSLPYSSPERIDTGHVDAHSDVWAAAVVLYEMLTTRPPFRADHPRALEQLIMSGAPPEPLPEGCSPALSAVLAKALAPNGADRHLGAAELRDDLQAVLEGAPIEETHRGMSNGAHTTNGTAATDLDATRSPGADDATRRTPAEDATRRAAASLDEATRRTPVASPATHDDTTRRSPAGAAVPVAPAAPPPAASPAIALAAGGGGFLKRAVRWARHIAIVVALALVANEMFVFNAAGELDGRIAGLARGDAAEVWSRYRRIDRRSKLRIAALRIAGPVKNWHVRMADDLMSSYLSDAPTIRENGWKQAAALLGRAATIAPGDDRIEARQRYVEGQLARIGAEAALARNSVTAMTRMNEARRAFEEATRLRRGWPDPWLGLARVHAIGYQDVDRTREALDGASRAGYRLGNRETALVADAHRLRAERAWKAVPGLPEEERYLERIRADCWRALELYAEVPAHGQVSRDIRATHALLAQVRAREVVLRAAAAESTSTGIIDELARAAGSLLGLE